MENDTTTILKLQFVNQNNSQNHCLQGIAGFAGTQVCMKVNEKGAAD
jgi:hypothetical protein